MVFDNAHATVQLCAATCHPRPSFGSALSTLAGPHHHGPWQPKNHMWRSQQSFKYWTPVMYAHHVFAPASSTFSKHLEHRSHHLNRQNIIQHHTLTTTINNYNKIQHHGHHLSLNPDVLSCPQGQEWQLHSVGLANGVYRCLHGRAKETKPRSSAMQISELCSIKWNAPTPTKPIKW